MANTLHLGRLLQLLVVPGLVQHKPGSTIDGGAGNAHASLEAVDRNAYMPHRLPRHKALD
ncbi:MAG: hypothetical protein ACQEXX_24130 [Bacillota bacterium]